MSIINSKTLHVSLCVVPGDKSFATQSTVIWILLNNPFTVSLWVVPWYDFPSTQCIIIQICSSMTLHVAPGDGIFLAHTEQWYGFSIVWIFMWRFVWPVVVWYLLCTYQILILCLWIICPFSTFSMLHFLLPSSHFFLSFRIFFINLTAMIKIVMPEVHTRILLHPHMLFPPLFRRVCAVALITIKLF